MNATQLYSTREAGEILGVTGMTVWRYVKAGRLRAVNLAEPGAARSKLRIRADDLQKFIDNRTLGLSAQAARD